MKYQIADTMKIFGNSAYGKTITNKENFKTTSYAKDGNISNNNKKSTFCRFRRINLQDI